MSLSTYAVGIKKKLADTFGQSADFVTMSLNQEGLRFFFYKIDTEKANVIKKFIEDYMAENHKDVPFKIIHFSGLT